MKMKKIILLCLIIFFISIAAVSAEDSNQTEDTLGVSENDDVLGDAPGNFTELKNVINGNISVSNITLGKDYTRVGSEAAITLSRELTIDGNGAVLNANGTGRIFSISTTSKVVLKNITFTGAKTSAIYYSAAANCEIINCTFIDNTISSSSSNGGGAAINFRSTGTDIKIINSTFANSKSLYGGGAAIYFYSTTYCEMINTTFENNTVENGCGGAIYASTFKNSNFTNVNFINNAVNLTGSYATSNYDTFGGGAIYAYGIDNCTFDNVNFTDGFVNVTRCEIDYVNNKPYRGGAAIMVSAATNSRFRNSNFVGNNVTVGLGGAIYFRYSSSKNNTFYNVNFTNNTASRGGAIAYDSTSSRDTFDYVTFEGNDAGVGGAIFYNREVTHTEFKNVTFIKNTGGDGGAIGQSWWANSRYGTSYHNENVTFVDTHFIANRGTDDDAMGGAITTSLGTTNFVFDRTEFVNNTAHGGGAINFGRDNNGDVRNRDVKFTNVDFIGNTATGNRKDGGVFYTTGTQTNYTFENCNFENNSAGAGGVFYFQDSATKFTFNNVNFTNNDAGSIGGVIAATQTFSNTVFNNTNFVDNHAGQEGGVLSQYKYYYTSSLYNITFTDSDFINNSAPSGGAISAGRETKINILTFEGGSFINNTATSSGGAVAIMENSNNVNFNNVDFEGNVANYTYGGGDGGAVAFLRPTTNSGFTNVTFNDNYAGGSGGAVYMGYPSSWTGSRSHNTTFDNVTFTNNSATANGGGVYAHGMNTTFNQVTFDNNSAGKGGAAYLTTDTYNTEIIGDTFNDCNFTNNHADSEASAIHCDKVDLNINGTNFVNNTGGSNVISTTMPTQISNSSFVNNSAESEIINQAKQQYGYQTDLTLNITGTAFENNTGNQSSVVRADSTSVHVNDSNFNNNSGTALSITNSQDNTIDNSNFSNHTVDGNGAAINLENSNTNITGSNFGFNNASGEGGAIYAADSELNIEGSNFINNTAFKGGAVSVVDTDQSSVTNSNFTNNSAVYGSAINFNNVDSANISDSNFSKNYVTYLRLVITTNSYDMSVIANLTGGNTQINAIYSDKDMVNYNHVMYLTDAGILNTDENISLYVNGVPHQNVTILVYDSEGNLVVNVTNLTDEKGIAIFRGLGLEKGNYTIEAYHFENTQYAYGEGEGEFKEIGNFTALQIMIDMTEDGGTLVLPQDLTYTIGLDEDEVGNTGVVINKNITIDGNGHFLDALGVSRIFYIPGSSYWDDDLGREVIIPMNVKLTNITFVNGNVSSPYIGEAGAGAIYGYTLNNFTLEYCTFENNSAYGEYYIDWHARDDGISVARNGAVALFNIQNSTISNCKFTNNTLENSDNGACTAALYVDGENIVISKCEFTDNHVNGSIGWWSYYSSYGGAAEVSGFNITMEDILFENNYADATNCNAYGGALVIYYAEESHFRNLTFRNNTAKDSAGALYIDQSYNSIFEDLTFEDNYVTEKYGSQAGSISIWEIYDSIFRNLTVINSNASIQGGAMYIGRSVNFIIEDSRFINNTVYGDENYPDMQSLGGAIYIDWAMITLIKNTTFEDNNADVGGAVYIIAGLNDEYSLNNTVIDSTFVRNNASSTGGAIFMSGMDGANFTVTGSKFINNTAGVGAGAIGVANSKYTVIKGSEFINNNGYLNDSIGGAIVLMEMGDFALIDNNTFVNNSADLGGALILNDTWFVNITNSKFEFNKAVFGSAVYLIVVDNIIFEENKFLDNKANSSNLYTGVLEDKQWVAATLVGNNNYANAIYSATDMENITFENVDYWAFPGMVNSDDVEIILSLEEIGQTVVFEFYDSENKLVKNASAKTNMSAIAKMPYYDLLPGEYAVKIYHPDNTYYTYVEGENRTVTVVDNGQGDFEILQKLINDLEDGETLQLYRNFTYNDKDTITNGIEIHGRNITIDANGFTIDASGHSRIFNITDSDVLIKNVTFKNGIAIAPETRGGAVYMESSDVIMENAYFMDNDAEEASDIYVYSGKLVMSDCELGNYDDNIHIGADGEASLTNVIQSSAESGNCIWNDGILSLNNNSFDNEIYNNMGKIVTKTNIVILENQLIIITEHSYDLVAKITDDNGNIINQNGFKFADGQKSIDATFDGQVYSGVYDDMTVGLHIINATFPGLENASIKTATIIVMQVTKLDLDINQINNHEKVIITATITPVVEGNITIMINNVIYPLEIGPDGKVNITLKNLTPGKYNVLATYDGSQFILNSSDNSSFRVVRLPSAITIDEITNTDKMVIKTTVTDGATGNVTFIVDDETYIRAVGEDLEIEKLIQGNHTIVAIYNGDRLYKSSNNNTVYTVDKYDSSVKVSVNDTACGEKVIINVEVPVEQTGNVTIVIGTDKWTKDIVSGKVTFEISGLAIDDYAVTAVYNGDGTYGTSNYTATFAVYKADLNASVSALNVTVKQNTSFIIGVPDDFDGKVKITVDDLIYDDYVKALIQMGNLTAGDKEATFEFYGASNYENETLTVNFTVREELEPVIKKASNVKVSVEDGKIIAFVENGAGGNITFNVNGKQYTREIHEGIAMLGDALAVGNNSIVAYFAGNDEFNSSVDSMIYNVPKLASQIKISVNDTAYGEDVMIVAEVPVGQTGSVTIIMGTDEWTKDIVSGKVTFEISGLAIDDYAVTAVYNGDGTYGASNYTATFAVYKADLNASVSALNVTVKQNTSFIIGVPDDFDGKVKITVDGVTYDGDAKSLINLANLTAGDKKAIVEFYGASNYENKTLTANFTVREEIEPVVKGESNIKVSVEDGKVIAVVEGDVDGNITFTVNGKEYTGEIHEGVAILEDALTVGNNSIVAYFAGNDEFNSSFDSMIYNVPKLSSEVKVSAENIVYGSDAIITAEVPSAQTGTVTITVNGESYTEEVKDGKAMFTIGDLGAGSYLIEVTYDGDDTYDVVANSSSFEVAKASLDASVSALNVTATQNASFIIDVPDDFDGKVKITVDGVTYDGDAKSLINLANLTAGDKKAIVEFYGASNYENKTLTANFTVKEEIEPVVKGESNIKVSVEDGKVIAVVEGDVGGNITFTVNGKEYTREIHEGVAILEDALTVGNNSIVAYFAGNDELNSSIDSMIYNVPKLASQVNVSAEDIVCGNGAVITVTVPDSQTGTVTIVVAGESYTEEVKDGKAMFTIGDLGAGSYLIEVTYDGDDTYDVVANSSSFEVAKASLDASVSALNVTATQNASFIIDVPDDFDGKVKITVGGVTYDGDAKSLINLANLTAGDKKAIVEFYGASNYENKTFAVEFKVDNETVDKKDTNVSISVKDDVITVDLDENATGYVTVYVNDKKFTLPVENGKAVLEDAPFKEGNNTVTVVYSGDDNYNLAHSDKNILIDNKNVVNISVENVIKYYSGPERFIVNVTYNNGTPVEGVEVKYTINGITYARTTDAEGIASLPLNLNSGNYTVGVEVADYNFTSTNHAEILPTIYANDVTKVFRNGTQYYALVLDGEGNPLVNTNVSFNINGVFYKRTSNASGWVRLNLNLEKGKYILTAINPVTKEMRSNIVTIITQIESSDLTKYYKNESQFIVRIRADDGGWVGAGEVVKFNIHGRLYERTTNETGHVVLNVNIEPGTYSITSYYKECREGNTIEVLPVLTADDMSMKYMDGSQFKAKVVDGQGNPYPDQTVTFNINGVFYNRTTDSGGIAKLNIKLQAGKYIITSEYETARISNTIKIGA